MSAEACELLAVAQELNFLGLPVRSDDVSEDLRKRLYRTKQNRPFRRPADPHQDVALLFETPAHMIFDRTNGVFGENVEVERRHEPGETAGIARVRPGARPHLDLLGGDVL